MRFYTNVQMIGNQFLGDHNLISSRNNFDVFDFEVEAEGIVSFANNYSIVIRSLVLLITHDQFDNTILTNGREVWQLIDCCCFKQFIQLLGKNLKLYYCQE